MEIVVFTDGVEVLSSFLLRFGSVWQAMVWNLMLLRRRWGGYTVN
jgi:hypothetical protein